MKYSLQILKVAAPLLGFSIGSHSGVCVTLFGKDGTSVEKSQALALRPGGGMVVLEAPLLQAVESPNLTFTREKPNCNINVIRKILSVPARCVRSDLLD